MVQALSENQPRISTDALRPMGSEIQSRVDEYLQRADASLMRRGATPAQRQSIHTELHERILNLFAARMNGQSSELDARK